MPEETVDQLKKMRLIEHMEIAIQDLYRYQSNKIVIVSMEQLHDALVMEYNSIYAPKPQEPLAEKPLSEDKT